MGFQLPTSTGATAGFLNQQQYDRVWKTVSLTQDDWWIPRFTPDPLNLKNFHLHKLTNFRKIIICWSPFCFCKPKRHVIFCWWISSLPNKNLSGLRVKQSQKQCWIFHSKCLLHISPKYFIFSLPTVIPWLSRSSSVFSTLARVTSAPARVSTWALLKVTLGISVSWAFNEVLPNERTKLGSLLQVALEWVLGT